MTALLVIGILVLLIVVHELGHFFAAKYFNVRVNEFGVGYPPRAFLFGKWGDTEYTLNWIPFGGFVQLFGENDQPSGGQGKGSFASAPRRVQAIILVAGVAMNAIAAWILFAGALTAGVPHQIASRAEATDAHLLITTVIPGSPAAVAGLGAGDELVAIHDGEGSPELVPEAIVEFVGERGGEKMEITYRRNGVENTVPVFPAHAVVAESAERPALGIGLALVTSEPMPFWKSIFVAIPITFDKLQSIFEGLGSMVANLFRGAPVLQEVVGPVGLVSVVGNAAEHGIANILILAGFISLNLAVVNLIPIPALDGGRLAILGVEALMRRRAPQFTVRLLNMVGVGLIAFLMITVTFNDIARLLG